MSASLIMSNKVLVISGAGEGLGSELAKAALRDGASVVLGARSDERLAVLSNTLEQDFPSRVAYCSTDITDPDACAKLMQTAVDHFGQLNAVSNIAALDNAFGGLADSTPEDWRNCFETNVLGSMNICAAAAPHIAAAGGGALVLTGTQAMFKAPPHPQIAYAASKSALIAAMNHLVKELGPQKIRVNMVIPTWMWGPAVEGYFNWQADEHGISVEEQMAAAIANMPLGEMPTVTDVAEAINFFCSDRARMITGEMLKVTAGEFM